MGLVIEQRADTLNQVGAAIVQFGMMPVEIQNESDQKRFSCLQEAFTRGFDQMDALRDGSLMYLEIRVGGVEGKVYRVGRSYVANMLDYAQMLNVKRNDVSEKLQRQGEEIKEIMVHRGTYRKGIPDYTMKSPDRFDIECIQAQMEGARSAYDLRVDDHRVKVFLDRALDGDTFRSPSVSERLRSSHVLFQNGNGNGNGS